MMQYICAALGYYSIISIIIDKWAKTDLSNLKNDLSNNSINSSLDDQYHPQDKKLYIQNREKLSDRY